MAERSTQHGGESVEQLVTRVGRRRPGRHAFHVIRAVGVAVEQCGCPEAVVAGLLGLVAPRAVERREVAGGVTEADRAIVAYIAGQPDPDGGLGADCSLRIGMQPDEVHAQLGQLGDDGQVVVRVRVTDSDGASVVSEPLTVTIANRSPTVSRVTWSPSDPSDNDDVVFTVQASDADGEVVGWIWTLDSGASGSSQEFVHAFEDDGSHSLSIVVRDNDGASSESYSITVPIRNAPPVAKFTAAQTSTCDGRGMQFDASESYDPSPTGRIVHMAWDFGDGTNCPGSSAGCADSERWAPEHCYSEPGTYIVTLVVIDEHGAASSTQKTILIGE